MTNNKKINNNIWWGIVLVSVLIIGGVIFINSKIPKEICNDEVSTKAITLEPLCFDSSWFGRECMKDVYFLEDNEESICEDGVSGFYSYIDDKYKWREYVGEGTKTCLIKTIKEVCEISYKKQNTKR